MKIKLGNEAERAFLFSDAIVHLLFHSAGMHPQMIQLAEDICNVQGESEPLNAVKG